MSLRPVQVQATDSQFCLLAFVVDDNAINRKVMKAMLEKLGCTVVMAVDGQDALDQIQSGLAPAIIFMDCQNARNGWLCGDQSDS